MAGTRKKIGTSSPAVAAKPSGGRKLLICESPGKLSTLKKILGPGWMVEASFGHLTELAQGGHHNWGFEIQGEKVLCKYDLRSSRAKDVVKKLKTAAQNAETVYLATDPDREGEAIAWHLVQELKLKVSSYRRMAFTQITKAAVTQALDKTRTLDFDLVHAQQARQCLDKMVGYEVSPLLWRSTGGRSAGRVQSATLHILCQRERERLCFKPENYWVLKSVYGEQFKATFRPKAVEAATANSTLEKADDHEQEHDSDRRVLTEDEAKRIESIARAQPHIVTAAERKVENRRPPAPLITSSLQQSAGSRYRFSPKHTMTIAQELYEGVSRGVGTGSAKGSEGLITYMRTDSPTLSPEFMKEAKAWLEENSAESVPEKQQSYKAKDSAQGAHEAIRPTDVSLTPQLARGFLTPDQLKLYTLIWERAVACQCKSAELSKTTVTIEAGETTWVAKGLSILDQGYLKFWNNLEGEEKLPDLKPGQILNLNDVEVEGKTTQPPPRYSEPRLIQVMEKKGIGRPSTFASTITTIKDRNYVVLEKSVLVPTALGMATDEMLMVHLPDLVDSAFTATMEHSLDAIAEGKIAWEKYLIDWNRNYLEPAVAKARLNLAQLPPPPVATAGPSSEVAGSEGPFPKAVGPASKGPYWGLSPDAQEKLEKALTKARKNKAVPPCALGHGDLELRLSRKGTFYWKCSCPGCEEKAWYRDFSTTKCPECNELMEKVPSRKVKGGNFLKCANLEKHEGKKDVVVFRNRVTGKWEAPGSAKTGSAAVAASPAPKFRNPADAEVPLYMPEREIWNTAYKPKAPIVPSQEVSLAARKALSAVARLNGLPSQNDGLDRVTIEGIIAVLVGRRSPAVLAGGYDKLPTFGQLQHWKEPDLHLLLDGLVDADCLRFSPTEGTLFLTAIGAEVMRATRPLVLNKPLHIGPPEGAPPF